MDNIVFLTLVEVVETRKIKFSNTVGVMVSVIWGFCSPRLPSRRRVLEASGYK